MVTEAEFNSTFERIKSLHNETFHVIDKAVRCEENEKPADALQNYKKGIEIIDETLAIPVGLPDDLESVQEKWNEACKMIHKLKRARAEVIQRVGILNHKYGGESSTSAENTSGDAAATKFVLGDDEEGRPRTYTELAEALRNMQCIENENNSLELLFNCEGVKLYQIKPDGVVTTTSDNSILRIVRLEKDESRQLNTTFFIQIIRSTSAVQIEPSILESENGEQSPPGDDSCSSPSPSSSFCIITHPDDPKDNFDGQDGSSWIYPLIPGVSPCYRTSYGAFIFPDLEAHEPGTTIGIVIPREDHADEIILEILEDILHGVVIEMKKDDGKRITPRSLSAKVSENLIRGANCISENLVKGAEKAGQMMTYSTPYLMSKMKRALPESSPVPQNVQSTVNAVKSVTGVASSVSGYVAGKVGSATMALGRFMAPHIQKHGSTVLSKGFGLTEEDASDKMSGVLTIAAGAVEGFGTIYSGLENSAKILGGNLSNNSVKIIEHRYGVSAGSVALGTFDTIGNVINVSQNISYMTPKGLVKKTAKNAGKAVVAEFRPPHFNENRPTYIPAAGIYPNLNGLEAAISK